MRSGSGVLLHRFEMAIAGVNGEESILVIDVGGWNDCACIIKLSKVIVGNFLFKKMNEGLVVVKIIGISCGELEFDKEFGQGVFILFPLYRFDVNVLQSFEIWILELRSQFLEEFVERRIGDCSVETFLYPEFHPLSWYSFGHKGEGEHYLILMSRISTVVL